MARIVTIMLGLCLGATFLLSGCAPGAKGTENTATSPVAWHHSAFPDRYRASKVDLKDSDPLFRKIVDYALSFDLCCARPTSNIVGTGTVGYLLATQAASCKANGIVFTPHGSRVIRESGDDYIVWFVTSEDLAEYIYTHRLSMSKAKVEPINNNARDLDWYARVKVCPSLK